MRQEDFERFDISYEGLDGAQRELRSQEALGVRLPSVRALVEEIIADLSVKDFGIGWWACVVPTGLDKPE